MRSRTYATLTLIVTWACPASALQLRFRPSFMRTGTMNKWMAAAGMLFMASAACAQVYECIDAKGRKEYAQVCSAGTVKETRIKERPLGNATAIDAAPQAGAPQPKSLAEQEAEFRKRHIERQEAEAKALREREEASANQANCASARAELKFLQDGRRFARADPVTGERVYVDEDYRASAIVKAQEAVTSWCDSK
jgi:hypothetical protein